MSVSASALMISFTRTSRAAVSCLGGVGSGSPMPPPKPNTSSSSAETARASAPPPPRSDIPPSLGA
eukprot:9120495-Pyramimonas_sp.AAC.1